MRYSRVSLAPQIQPLQLYRSSRGTRPGANAGCSVTLTRPADVRLDTPRRGACRAWAGDPYLTRSASADLALMRASLLLESDPAAAARSAAEILAGAPGHAAASLLLATARRRLGEPALAASVLEPLVSTRADSSVIQLELGRAYAAAGRIAEAAGAFRRAVTLDAALADAWRELAAQLHAGGETVEGDRAYARYSALSSPPPELGEAIVALGNNRPEAAATQLRRRLQQAPRDALALRLLADAATRLEDDVEAERRLKECLVLAPGYAQARYELARLLNEYQRFDEMLPHVERLLACDPGNVDYLNLKAQALRFGGRSHEAVALMEQLLADHPDQEQSWVLCG